MDIPRNTSYTGIHDTSYPGIHNTSYTGIHIHHSLAYTIHHTLAYTIHHTLAYTIHHTLAYTIQHTLAYTIHHTLAYTIQHTLAYTIHHCFVSLKQWQHVTTYYQYYTRTVSCINGNFNLESICVFIGTSFLILSVIVFLILMCLRIMVKMYNHGVHAVLWKYIHFYSKKMQCEILIFWPYSVYLYICTWPLAINFADMPINILSFSLFCL